MKVVSVIGCGWLGLPLAMELVRRGYTVKGSTRSDAKLKELERRGVSGFVLDLDEGVPPDPDLLDCDVLFLNVPPGRGSDVEQRYPARMETALAGLSQSCERVIFVSSTSVYPSCNARVSESFVGEPDKISGRALLAAEALIDGGETDGVILRMGGLIGPGRMPGNFLAGKTDVRQGDSPVNLLHQVDAIGVSLDAIEGRLSAGVYNVVCDDHPTRREYYTAAAKHLGVSVPSFADDTEARWKVIDNAKIKAASGYRFRPLEVK